jgi:uncharacterized coiled-coil protein SlyX
MILKILFAFLLGFVLGAVGAGFLVTSPAGNALIAPVIAANPRVQDLERKIREAEEQRASVTRQLNEVTDRMEQMGHHFEELQRRFEAMQRSGTDRPTATLPPAEPPAPAAGAPSAR